MIYILDTNVVSDFLKQQAIVTASIMRNLAQGERLLIAQPVHFELVRGLLRHNATAQLNQLDTFILPQLEWTGLTDADWQQAARFWAASVSQGKQLSDVDLLLAALTYRLNATLVSADDDFDTLPIKRANWRIG